MQSDFATKCKRAVYTAKVPPIPMVAIRKAVSPRSTKRRATLLYSALFVAASGLTAAFGAQVLNRAYVYFGAPSGPHVVSQSLSVSWQPTAAQLRSVLSHASYNVVVPSGLPKGTRLEHLGNIGRDVVIFWYTYPRGGSRSHGTASMLVASPETLSMLRKVVQQGVTVKTKGDNAGIHWRIGGEEVVMLGNTLSPAEIAQVREAMTKQPCVLLSQIGHGTANPTRVLQGCTYQFGPAATHK